MNAQELISNLASQLEIELTLSSQNTCGVIFENDIIEIEVTQKHIYFISSLAPIVDSKKSFEHLLRINFLGTNTAYATISIDQDTFMLHRILPTQMEFSDFYEAFTLFLQAIRYWKEWIALDKLQDHGAEGEVIISEGAMRA